MVLPVNKLTEEERKHPEKVFDQFFNMEIGRLCDAKELLWEVFDDLTKKQYKHKEGSKKYAATLYMFEKIERVLEAAWVMR